MSAVKLQGATISAAACVIDRCAAWEKPYTASIQALRDEELGHLRDVKVVRAVSSSFMRTLPLMACFVSFAIYAYVVQQSIDPASIFTSFLRAHGDLLVKAR